MSKITLDTIQKQFPDLITSTMGQGSTIIDNANSIKEARSGSIIFVVDLKLLENALQSPAACVVVPAKSKEAVEKLVETNAKVKNILFSTNVKLVMALVIKEFFAIETPLQKRGVVHSTAVVDSTAIIGQNVTVGAYTVIGENVIIGDNVQIDASVIIEADCKIGSESHLYSHLYLGPRTEVGERCELLPHSTIGAPGFGFAPNEKGHFSRIPHIGKVVLQNDVEVGSNTTIDRGTFGVTLIGEGTKIDKQAHIAHNCEIGKHCALAGSFAVAGSTKIGNHFISGGRVTVKDNITITDRVEVAGLSAVHGSVTESGQYGGHPLQPIREYMKMVMSVPHIPRLRKDMTKILKHLNLNEEKSDS